VGARAKGDPHCNRGPCRCWDGRRLLGDPGSRQFAAYGGYHVGRAGILDFRFQRADAERIEDRVNVNANAVAGGTEVTGCVAVGRRPHSGVVIVTDLACDGSDHTRDRPDHTGGGSDHARDGPDHLRASSTPSAYRCCRVHGELPGGGIDQRVWLRLVGRGAILGPGTGLRRRTAVVSEPLRR
jgi:hypothetical protein